MNKNTELANNIVQAILSDVTDRRGWRQEWDQFDDDIKKEIKASWKSLILGEMEKSSKT